MQRPSIQGVVQADLQAAAMQVTSAAAAAAQQKVACLSATGTVCTACTRCASDALQGVVLADLQGAAMQVALSMVMVRCLSHLGSSHVLLAKAVAPFWPPDSSR
jgi:hypothetical protein